jgi:hypothetical protein
MTTMSQVDANHRNAQLSTGPKSLEGKAASSRNATKHGYTAKVKSDEIALSEPAFADRYVEWFEVYQPSSGVSDWLLRTMVATSLKLDHCLAEQESERKVFALRAIASWDDDRSLDSALLYEKIASKPISVSRRLEATFHGCECMIVEWKGLKSMIEFDRGLRPEFREIALNLLGVNPLLRSIATTIDPPADAADPVAWLIDRIQREIDCLESQMANGLAQSSQLRKDEAIKGLGYIDSPAGRRLARYERELTRRLADLKREFLAHETEHEIALAIETDSEVETEPAQSPSTPPNPDPQAADRVTSTSRPTPSQTSNRMPTSIDDIAADRAFAADNSGPALWFKRRSDTIQKLFESVGASFDPDEPIDFHATGK